MKRPPLLRRTRLRARSAKTAERDRLRREFRDELLHRRPWCEIGPVLADAMGDPDRWSPACYSVIGKALTACTAKAVDVHEVVKRSRGGSVLDPSNTLCVCRPCHRLTEDEPALATALGFLKSSWTPL